MKRIFTLLLLVPALVYLSSCSNNNATLITAPVYDSVSLGSVVDLSFFYKTFLIKDLSVNNSAVYTMTASVNNVAPDSFEAAAIVLTDHTSKKLSMNLSLARDTTGSIGVYTVTTNNSTVTDYSGGGAVVYSVTIGSTVNITSIGINYITGTMDLHIYNNHDTTSATGYFKIFN